VQSSVAPDIAGFITGGHPGPNCLMPADRGPLERNPRPLNSRR
jgi:hypothetical protein